MTIVEFTIATALLLAAPGPTNTLISLAGYERGVLRALPLLSAEIGGYLTVITPIVTLAAAMVEEHATAMNWLRLAAGIWVLYLALRLWKRDRIGANVRAVSWLKVFSTTVFNPKALIISLIMMPHGPLSLVAPWLGLFAMLTLVIGFVWIVAGSTLNAVADSATYSLLARRIAALFLVGFAVILTGTSVANMY